MEVTNKTAVEAYAVEINGYAAKTAEMIVRIGDAFNRAKDSLPHGEFSKLFDLTPVGQRTAQRYMKIASSGEVQQLLKSDTMSHLNTKQLYDVAVGKEEEVEESHSDRVDRLRLEYLEAKIEKNMYDMNMPIIEAMRDLTEDEFKELVLSVELTEDAIEEAKRYKVRMGI